jgi:hypothetical protein
MEMPQTWSILRQMKIRKDVHFPFTRPDENGNYLNKSVEYFIHNQMFFTWVDEITSHI